MPGCQQNSQRSLGVVKRSVCRHRCPYVLRQRSQFVRGKRWPGLPRQRQRVVDWVDELHPGLTRRLLDEHLIERCVVEKDRMRTYKRCERLHRISWSLTFAVNGILRDSR